MILDIHGQAKTHFSEKVLSLISDLQILIPQKTDESTVDKFPRGHVSATLKDDDISFVGTTIVDKSGTKIGRFTYCDEKQVGFHDDKYIQFEKVCESIQKAIKPHEVISKSSVEEKVFEWIISSWQGDAEIEFVDFLLRELAKEISEYEIWIPIAGIRIQSSFNIGKISFVPLTKELIDQWQEASTSASLDDDKKLLAQFFELKIRKPMQGWVASVMKISADPTAAQDIAMRETERALSVLRVFSPAAITPRSICYLSVLGKENIESVTILTFKEKEISNYFSEIIGKDQKYLDVDDTYLEKARLAGLEELSLLLKLSHQTEFQETLLNAVILYSEATRHRDLSSRLVYLLAALESIYIKDSNEPIQQNLGERMATLLGKTLDEKKKIIKNVKEIYSKRSAFVHHAHSLDDIEEFEKFSYNAWLVLIQAIKSYDQFKSKHEYISSIDDYKLMPIKNVDRE